MFVRLSRLCKPGKMSYTAAPALRDGVTVAESSLSYRVNFWPFWATK